MTFDDALNRLAPPLPWEPNWADVLGRAREHEQYLFAEITSDRTRAGWSRLNAVGARSHQRRLAVVLATAAILAALIATPAFGVRGALLHLLGRIDVPFTGAPPAASVMKRQFADMSSGAPKGMDPRVNALQTRLAGTLDFGGVKRHVWVAPTQTGGFCYQLEGIFGGCTEIRTDTIVLNGGFFARAGATTPAVESLAGRIYAPQATQLRVIFEDGRMKVLPFIYVSEPINAGFFAYKPTPAEDQPGHRPADVVAVDATGAEIGRTTIDWANEERKLRQVIDTFSKKPRPVKPSATTTDLP
jgi:hypothetical protein